MNRSLLGLFVFLAACSSQSSYIAVPITDTSLNRHTIDACKIFYQSLDRAVDDAGVRDAQWHIVQGFPFLRTDRFLASFHQAPMDKKRVNAWIDHMQAFDLQAREFEIQNLAGTPQLQHLRKNGDVGSIRETMLECNNLLRQALAVNPTMVKTLRQNVTVPDDYISWKRGLGIYPISSQFVNIGIRKYRKDTLRTFKKSIKQLTSHGLLTRYSPGKTGKILTSERIAAMFTKGSKNPLELPILLKTVMQKLFQQFAPVLEIDISGRYDQIGKVKLTTEGKPIIYAKQPTLYIYSSFTNFRGNTLLQLNYSFWFPHRPPNKKIDILSGYLDGITWRVTLAASGKPIMFDAIHNCGCYHMLFPAENFFLNPEAELLPQPPLIPQRAPNLKQNQRMVIRIGSIEHDIQRIYAVDGNVRGHAYKLEDYNLLRSLYAGDSKRKSMFAANGIVEGTQRAERFFLWPMGITSPGAMRQQGRHPVAFRGRRHFDDADLLERLFIVK